MSKKSNIAIIVLLAFTFHTLTSNFPATKVDQGRTQQKITEAVCVMEGKGYFIAENGQKISTGARWSLGDENFHNILDDGTNTDSSNFSIYIQKSTVERDPFSEKSRKTSCRFEYPKVDVSIDDELKQSCRRNPRCSDDINVGRFRTGFQNSSFEALVDIDNDSLKERAAVNIIFTESSSYKTNDSYTSYNYPKKWVLRWK